MKLLRRVFLGLLVVMILGCGNAKYGKCQSCGKMFGVRGGNLPGQHSSCERCGGHIYWPAYKSEDYYKFKQDYGGTED